MEQLSLFRRRVAETLSKIDRDVLGYPEEEFWMIRSVYEYLEFYAERRRLFNTAVALPLVRGVHSGSYRKSPLIRDGKSYRVPYVIHCLMTCRMLVDLHLPLSAEDEDAVLTAALCHDMIEDIPFPKHGLELMEDYHLSPRVYEIVKKLSKRKDFTPEEEQAHVRAIEEDSLALLIKLSDRGHNVEDMYNMTAWKVHEYIGETRNLFLPMVEYGKEHYPELLSSLLILKDKLVTLMETAEILVDRYEEREEELRRTVRELTEENERLRLRWQQLWKDGNGNG